MKTIFELYKELYKKGKDENNLEAMKAAARILILMDSFKTSEAGLDSLLKNSALLSAKIYEMKDIHEMDSFIPLMDKAAILEEKNFLKNNHDTVKITSVIANGVKSHDLISLDEEVIPYTGYEAREYPNVGTKPDNKFNSFLEKLPKTEVSPSLKSLFDKIQGLKWSMDFYNQDPNLSAEEENKIFQERAENEKKLKSYCKTILNALNKEMDSIRVQKIMNNEPFDQYQNFKVSDSINMENILDAINANKISIPFTEADLKRADKDAEKYAKLDVLEESDMPLIHFLNSDKLDFVRSQDYGYDNRKYNLNDEWLHFEKKTNEHSKMVEGNFIFDHPEIAKYTTIGDESIYMNEHLYPKYDEAKEVFNTYAPMTFDKEEKEGLKKIYLKMEELGFFNLPKNYNGEDGGKEYAFRFLWNKHNSIVEDLKNKNLDLAYDEAKEYERMMGDYRTIISMIKEVFPQDGLHHMGNLESTRNGHIPLEFAKDPIASCQLNGIFLLGVTLKNDGIDPENFFDHLEDAVPMLIKKQNESYLERLNNSGDGNLSKRFAHLIFDNKGVSYVAGRGLDIIGNLSGAHGNSNSICALLNKDVIAKTYAGDFEGAFLVRKEGEMLIPDMEGMRNYLAAGDKVPMEYFYNNTMVDFEHGGHYEAKFNYEEFLEQDDSDPEELFTSLLDKLAEIEIEYSRLCHEKSGDQAMFNSAYHVCFYSMTEASYAAASYLKDVIKKNGDFDISPVMKNRMDKFLEDPFNMTKEYTKYYKSEHGIDFSLVYPESVKKELNHSYVLESKVATSIMDNEKERISSYRTHIHNQNAETLTDEYYNRYNNNNTSITSKNAMQAVVIGKQVYSSYSRRTIFGRWLRPEAWKEWNLYKEIKNDLTNNGISLDKCMNAIRGNDEDIITVLNTFKDKETKDTYTMTEAKYQELKNSGSLAQRKRELETLYKYASSSEERQMFEKSLEDIEAFKENEIVPLEPKDGIEEDDPDLSRRSYEVPDDELEHEDEKEQENENEKSDDNREEDMEIETSKK